MQLGPRRGARRSGPSRYSKPAAGQSQGAVATSVASEPVAGVVGAAETGIRHSLWRLAPLGVFQPKGNLQGELEIPTLTRMNVRPGQRLDLARFASIHPWWIA